MATCADMLACFIVATWQEVETSATEPAQLRATRMATSTDMLARFIATTWEEVET